MVRSDDDIVIADLNKLERAIRQEKMEMQNKTRISQAQVWLAFLRFLKPGHHSLQILVLVLLSTAGGNAGIERFIKVLKLVKTKIRNRLSAEIFEKLLLLYCFCDLDKIDYQAVLNKM